MDKNSRIYVAGHTGLLGSALMRRLAVHGYHNILVRTHRELELTDQRAVREFFSEHKPEYVFLAAGKVGGIVANRTRRADFLHTNVSIQDNVFEAANTHGVKNLVFYGSSCTYPKACPQPMKEEHLLTGPIEETSEAYAAAKIAGIIACKSYNIQYQSNKFIALVPNSMYGPHDNFDEENSHVLSALMGKFHKAVIEGSQRIELWGSGTPRREFVFSEDIADASIFAMQNHDRFANRHYNIGTGTDRSIKELAEKMAQLTGFGGEIFWDTTKPDGTARKLLDSTEFLAMGWQPKVSFDAGLQTTYDWFVGNSGETQLRNCERKKNG